MSFFTKAQNQSTWKKLMEEEYINVQIQKIHIYLWVKINLAFTALPDNRSQHTIDQSNFNKLSSALDSNKMIYVRTACNLFVVHSIYSMYSGANRGIVHLYFHFNIGNMNSETMNLEEITRDINGYITIDMAQTPDESNNYTYTVYTTSLIMY